MVSIWGAKKIYKVVIVIRYDSTVLLEGLFMEIYFLSGLIFLSHVKRKGT